MGRVTLAHKWKEGTTLNRGDWVMSEKLDGIIHVYLVAICFIYCCMQACALSILAEDSGRETDWYYLHFLYYCSFLSPCYT